MRSSPRGEIVTVGIGGREIVLVFGVVFVFVIVFGFVLGFVFERTVIVVTGRVEAEDEHEDDTGRGA